MSERKRRKRRLPRVCECGGELEYAFGPGDYMSVGCRNCTPVVEVRVRTSIEALRAAPHTEAPQ